ncbi:DnaJ domain-containing protein [Rhizobium sp.]|uniref:DnaJ domain-containing protein n=1 Tax=Rhizobium sp. TaxID=391 RepID=UPI000E853102|nr:molecular chaperone DnaJ [Rhizobium sp.]
MRDPYSILGVRRDAGSDEIKAAWRSKAKTSHPDQNRDDPSATQRFAEIGQAYDVLKDKDKRSRYDQRLSQMESMKREQTIMQQREEARAAAERARQAKANAERVMADLARIEAEKAKAEKAAEALNAKVDAARVKAKAAEAQAATAAKAQAAAQQANTQQSSAQQSNQASGAKENSGTTAADPAAAANTAPNEAETVAEQDSGQNAAEALFTAKTDGSKKPDNGGIAEPAPSGIFALPVIGLITSLLVRRVRKPAPVLEKAPDLAVEATIAIDDLLKQNIISLHLSDGRDIRLPLEPGHTDGTIIRMEGKGLKIPGMLTGDVVATLRVLRGGPCTIDGYDIRCTLKLPLEDAVLGCETTVDGPVGPVKVTVPAWSGSEQSIRVDNQGLPISDNECGALVVDIRVTLAEKPNEKLTDLMKVMKHGLFL